MYYGYYFDWTYILVIIGVIITMVAQAKVSSSYSKYKQVNSRALMTGKEVARKILDKNGLSNVAVKEVAGNLTDHYDPSKKTVNLSTDIYKDSSIASIAVAAHECGHAIQDKNGYTFLRIRHAIVPVVNFCSRSGYVVIGLGLLFGYFEMAMIGLVLLCGILIFQLVTLPVEFNASKRAKEELKGLGVMDSDSGDGVADMLKAAALTYVAALASTLLQLLRMFILVMGNRRNND